VQFVEAGDVVCSGGISGMRSNDIIILPVRHNFEFQKNIIHMSRNLQIPCRLCFQPSLSVRPSTRLPSWLFRWVEHSPGNKSSDFGPDLYEDLDPGIS